MFDKLLEEQIHSIKRENERKKTNLDLHPIDYLKLDFELNMLVMLVNKIDWVNRMEMWANKMEKLDLNHSEIIQRKKRFDLNELYEGLVGE